MKNKSVAFRKFIWLLFLVGGALVSVLIDLLHFTALFQNIYFHIVSFILGITLLRFVLTVARNTGRTLAKFGRKGNLPRFETNVLVTQGVYSYMRHPMHLGLIFFPLSVALIIGSPTFIFIIAPLEMLFMIIMIFTYEEKEAIEKFGEDYLEYKKKVPFFCFKPECIGALLKEVKKNSI